MLAQEGVAEPVDRLSAYSIDSTKIDPHKLKTNSKCLREKAGLGHTHEGFYIGFKLHVVANRKGQIVAFDLAPVKDGMLDGRSRSRLGSNQTRFDG